MGSLKLMWLSLGDWRMGLSAGTAPTANRTLILYGIRDVLDTSIRSVYCELLQTLGSFRRRTREHAHPGCRRSLFEDGQGGLRLSARRLSRRIVHAFEDGATPEGIVQSYDTLQLADVYAVLTWYLRHKTDVEDYLHKRAEEAEAIRQTIEAKQPDRAELRARLMARRAQKEGAHAPSPQ